MKVEAEHGGNEKERKNETTRERRNR